MILNNYNRENTKTFNDKLKNNKITSVFKKCHNKTCFCSGLCMEISHYETSDGKKINVGDIFNYIK